MISDTINQKIIDALKAHDEIKLSTLRMLSSAFNYERIALQKDLTEEDELRVVRREAKKRTDAIEALQKAQGKSTTSSEEDLKNNLEKEKKELEILKSYLPPEMSDEELSQLVNESINQLGVKSIQDMGKVIGSVMQQAGGKAEGNKVAQMVKNKLI